MLSSIPYDITHISAESTIEFIYLDSNKWPVICIQSRSHFAILGSKHKAVKVCIPVIIGRLEKNSSYKNVLHNCKIIIPMWIQSLFGYKPEIQSIKSIMSTNFVARTNVSHANVTLQYIGYYHELGLCDSLQLLSLPSTLITTWPNSPSIRYSPSTVEKFLPILLNKNILCQNSYITIQFLDTFLLCQVLLSPTTDSEALSYDDNLNHIYWDLSLSSQISFKLSINLINSNPKASHPLLNSLPDLKSPTTSKSNHSSVHICDVGNIVTNLLKLIKSSETIVYNGPKAVLLSGPTGCGKSYVFQNIKTQLLLQQQKQHQSQVTCSTYNPFITVTFSANDIRSNYHLQNSDDDLESILNSSYDEKQPETILSLLVKLINMFEWEISCTLVNNCEIISSKSLSNCDVSFLECLQSYMLTYSNPKIVLIIEDIDHLLFSPLFAGADSESNKVDTTISNNMELSLLYSNASLYLRKLLESLIEDSYNFPCSKKQSSQQSFQLIILGSTRLLPSNLPSHHIGAPMFEKVILMPRPTFFEREIIIYNELTNYSNTNYISYQNIIDLKIKTLGNNVQSKYENNEYSNDCEIRREWSKRISGLTRGYLPGDIINILSKALFMHQQTLSKLSSSLPSGNSNQNTMSWRSMLEVISYSTPASLQTFQQSKIMTTSTKFDNNSEAADLDSNDIFQDFSWNRFGGYHTQINKLQQILSLVQTYTNINANTISNINEVNNQDLNHISSLITSTVANNEESNVCETKNKNIINVNDTTNLSINNHSNLTSNSFHKTSRNIGIVLHGPSGCGKTFLASIIAKQANMNFISIKCTELISKYFGETEGSVRELFTKARASTPCVLFFDDFDSISCTRESLGKGGDASKEMSTRVLSTFLNELDGISVATTHQSQSSDDILIVIVACSSIKRLDPALIRPGRLRYHIELKYPNKYDICCIFESYLQTITFLLKDSNITSESLTNLLLNISSAKFNNDNDCMESKNNNYQTISNTSLEITKKAFTAADIAGICRRAKLICIRELIYQKSLNDTNSNICSSVIELRHFKEAMEELYNKK